MNVRYVFSMYPGTLNARFTCICGKSGRTEQVLMNAQQKEKLRLLSKIYEEEKEDEAGVKKLFDEIFKKYIEQDKIPEPPSSGNFSVKHSNPNSLSIKFLNEIGADMADIDSFNIAYTI